MFPVPDAIAAFYLVCFLVGLVFVLVSAVVGYGHDLAHLPGLHVGSDVGDGGGHVGADAGHGGHGPGDLHAGHGVGDGSGADGGVGASHGHAVHSHGRSVAGASPLNLMTVMAFLTWFGGVGYALHAVYGALLPISLLGGLATGLLAGWLVHLLLVRVLLPGSAARDARQNRVVGSLARVTIGIAEGGVGEIIYTMDGSRHSDGARSVDGLPIPSGAEVVITRFEGGIAYVQAWDRFVQERPDAKRRELRRPD